MEHVDIVEVTSTDINPSGRSNVDSNFVVETAGATPHAWLKGTGLTLHDGFIEIRSVLTDAYEHSSCKIKLWF